MDWVRSGAIIVALQYLAAMMIGMGVGFHYSIPFTAYLIAGLTVAIVGGYLLSLLRFRRPDHSATAEYAIGCVLVALQMAVLTWLKTMLPIVTGFWADPYLAAADGALGLEPWRAAQFLFGWAAGAIDRAYIIWAPLKFAVLLATLALPVHRGRAMLSYFLIVSMTALGQYALPSAGPVFYSALGYGDRFADLPIQPWVDTARSYLWANYQRGGGSIGTGISAMPSLHVAIALWIALVARSLLSRFEWIGWIYFGLIFVGSILTGWHYALDSVAGCGITGLAWRLCRDQREAKPFLVGRVRQCQGG